MVGTPVDMHHSGNSPDNAGCAVSAHCDAMRYPLFVGDPKKLARKLDHCGGLLRQYRDDFRATFLAKAATRADMIFLPALIDGEGVNEARQLLLTRCDMLSQEYATDSVQFHTWCRCGAVTRHAVFVDWLSSRGAWSNAEIEQLAESLIAFAFKYAYPVLASRTRASDNQALSLALHCAVVGFLFGHKLTNHPTAKFLFDYGLGRLPDLIGLFPRDGYGGEGSTYTSRVNTPLLCWTADLLEQLTGRDWTDVPFMPNGTTLRNTINMEMRLISPGGLLAPWDHYGWQRAIHSSPFAYLARMTADPRYLSMIPALTDWSNPGSLAWGADDPMWTLLWWPEELADYDKRDLPADLFGWFLPCTGAALDDVPRRARLMQVWDACADSITGVSRAQCNPNHLMFDYGGEPVFQDGVPDKNAEPWQISPEDILLSLDPQERERFAAYARSYGDQSTALAGYVRHIAPGMIGGANAIVIDEEPWYWPGGSRVGQAKSYAREDTVQIVSADCAAYYQPRYDVTIARRTSLWCDDGFGVVHDVLAADSSHTWRWQIHLRPDVQLDANTARITLPGGRSVLLAWDATDETRLNRIDGFPATEEKRCDRLDLLRRGSTAEFAVLIAPEATHASIVRVNDAEFDIAVDGRTRRISMARADNVEGIAPDVHRLPDIDIDRDPQFPELERLLQWTCVPVAPGASALSRIDACMAQLVAATPDVQMLLASLEDRNWSVRLAATEVLGRCRCREALVPLRRLLRSEHAIAHELLYPPMDAASDEGAARRWRLKAAVITALGRLRDRRAIAILKQILDDNRDFYPVYSAAAQAIGRIGGPGARTALSLALKDSEPNTLARATAALAHLRDDNQRKARVPAM